MTGNGGSALEVLGRRTTTSAPANLVLMPLRTIIVLRSLAARPRATVALEKVAHSGAKTNDVLAP
jgi:hypothetical protein